MVRQQRAWKAAAWIAGGAVLCGAVKFGVVSFELPGFETAALGAPTPPGAGPRLTNVPRDTTRLGAGTNRGSTVFPGADGSRIEVEDIQIPPGGGPPRARVVVRPRRNSHSVPPSRRGWRWASWGRSINRASTVRERAG